MSDEASNSVTGNLPIPHYERLFGREEALSGIDKVLSLATKQLRVFDITLADRGFNSPARIEQLKNYLLRSRDNKLRIVLHDVHKLDSECTRLVNLARQFPSAVQIQKTLDKAKHAADPLIIADDHSYWHLLHFEQPRSILQLRHELETAPWIERFEQLWEASEPYSLTSLGL
jgi:hypothetical protein